MDIEHIIFPDWESMQEGEREAVSRTLNYLGRNFGDIFYVPESLPPIGMDVTIRGISKALREVYGLTYDTVINNRAKHLPIVTARQAVCSFLRSKGMTLMAIGQILGKHHSTILANLNTFDGLIATDPSERRRYNEFVKMVKAYKQSCN